MSFKENAKRALFEVYRPFAGADLPFRNELMYHMKKIEELAEMRDEHRDITISKEEMLSAQMEYRKPKKPIVTVTQYFGIPSLTVFSCPTCKRILRATKSENKDKFCPSCGQAIDWTEVQV